MSAKHSTPYLQVAVDPGKDLNELMRRLQKGQVVRARIVYCLGQNRYLLRIYGYNMIMESPLPFERFDEASVIVERLYPRFSLRLLEKKEKRNNDGKTNLLI